MTADEKIKESERWLEKIMRSDHHSNRTDLMDNVIAFLNCVNSIPDHLLEEYNQKFLGITLQDKLFPNVFKIEAKKQSHHVAQQFIMDFKSEKGKIESDPIGKILTTKRDLNTHRDNQKTNKLVVVVGGVKKSDAFSVNFPELVGNVDDSCEKLLNLMKGLVSILRNKYP